ncbi:type I-B CRISPR-associated protein Cas7/Cst2/DevR [Methanobacterium formicicum]|uniref:CRISPR-associated negative autoregulator, DevR family n=1 Tax=Methanobacterium formicicum TaxID=2162 RepID=A0A090I410_METFO|nr:type I-B CRISPR-associated protein Cas7/Cst2/DevR [Methanobacterium formicicum]MDH2658716.1 type I-B CRISPR-associated protein Cas7/Cst2/DevR [Methanobacterium formicicum]CEA12445.1 CRISPR-associated negative autoregulator, DevR family [Methanobacterium formicicum]
MGRYIVMDIVFYGNSLNYDQGSGNYQELKKITKWDGRQYSLVSRYALRYSLLETAKNMSLWKLAGGEDLTAAGSGDKKVIQPAVDFLLSGKIIEYPEFDLFGYLITGTTPQNFRTAPVKINHAVSMTQFNYDALFNANLGLANRMRKRFGDMKPNPFTAEEHETFYQYTVVVDVDNIGEVEVYVNKGSDINFKGDKWKISEIQLDGTVTVELEKGKGKKKESDQVNQSANVEKLDSTELENNLVLIKYSLKEEDYDPVKERVIELLKAILNLKRSIKGREEDLSPKLLIMGVYKDKPYQTYKDKITLLDEYVEEEYDEIEETPTSNGGRLVKVRHKTTKSRKPKFEIQGLSGDSELITEENLLNLIEDLFDQKKSTECVKIFKDPSITVDIKGKRE